MTRSSVPDERLERRQATHGDESFCRVVHHAALRDVVLRQFGTWDEAAQDEFFADDWHPEETSILLLRGVTCGYCKVERVDHEYLVHAIYLLPEFQQRGLGTGFLKEVLSRADREGVPTSLQVLHANRASSLYERLGFLEYGRTETHRCMRRPVPMDSQ